MSLADFQLAEILAHLQKVRDECTAGLRTAEDWKALWSVNHDFAKVLNLFGIFGVQEKQPEPSDPSDTEASTRAEIQAMVNLEQKQRKRQMEMQDEAVKEPL